jgi:cytosine/adenosine deaminase-related metal-dependent hydrolase
VDDPVSLKVERARYVLTVGPSRTIIRDASIVVAGGRITHVGKADELADVRADRVIDGLGMLVTPAFVCAHMHISYAHAVRGIYPDDVVGPARLADVFRLQSAMTEEEEYWTSLLAIIELARSGTGVIVDPGTTRHIDACLQAYEDSGLRFVTGTAVTDLPDAKPLSRYSTAEAIAVTDRFIRRYDGQLGGRLRAAAVPFATDNCSPELLVGIRRLADEVGVIVLVHHASNDAQREASQSSHGSSPTAYLDSLGAFGPNVLVAHLIGLDDSEAEVIARSGAAVAFCPSATLKERRNARDSRLPELLARGVRVGIGGDSANNSNYLDMVRQMNVLAVQFKDARQDLRLVPAEQALELATITGAAAVGMDGDVGSIEVGKKADLVLFDTRRAEWSAVFNPVNNLIYGADAASVHTVIVDGVPVVENSEVTFANEAHVADRVQEHGERLLARAGARWPLSRWPIQ